MSKMKKQTKENSILPSIQKAMLIKEAKASCSLDGETQTFDSQQTKPTLLNRESLEGTPSVKDKTAGKNRQLATQKVENEVKLQTNNVADYIHKNPTQTAQFNLSEKRQGMSNSYGYSDEDVKEFIKLLKEELVNTVFENQPLSETEGMIDKLAGEKLC